MFCTQCGQQNPDNAKFCSQCGAQIQLATSNKHIDGLPPVLNKSIYQTPNGYNGQADEFLALFVGEKYNSYYRQKWFDGKQPVLETKAVPMFSFNVAGFFFGFMWLCYRKSYFYAFLIVTLLTVFDLIKTHSSDPLEYNTFGVLTFGAISIMFTAFMGNFFYYEHCLKEIRKITSQNQDLYLTKQRLLQRGGVSWGGAIGGTILILALTILAYYLFAPEWFWY